MSDPPRMSGPAGAKNDTATARVALGARIAQARGAAGYDNAAEFARQIGVSPNSVYRWERGELAPDVFSIVAIAHVARVSCHWLLTGAADRTAPLEREPALLLAIEEAVERAVTRAASGILERVREYFRRP
jgi:transcriptional regulator with XRE-family HTH domain